MAGEPFDAIRCKPACVDEALERDEKRIAGEGGESRVGRTTVAGWIERENLPETLLARGEEVDKSEGGRAEIADAAVRGKRGDVQ